MAKEETTFNYHLWLAKQELSKFRVVYGDNRQVVVLGHEALIDAPQPILRIVRYHIKELEVTKVSGGTKNRKESSAIEEHVVATLAASFSPGAWASVVDMYSELTPVPPRDPVEEEE